MFQEASSRWFLFLTDEDCLCFADAISIHISSFCARCNNFLVPCTRVKYMWSDHCFVECQLNDVNNIVDRRQKNSRNRTLRDDWAKPKIGILHSISCCCCCGIFYTHFIRILDTMLKKKRKTVLCFHIFLCLRSVSTVFFFSFVLYYFMVLNFWWMEFSGSTASNKNCTGMWTQR